MPESSSAPAKIMLLLLTSGLLMAAWSADGGHVADDDGQLATSHTYSSGSAIAVLMHLPSDDKQCDDSPRASKEKRNASAQLDANDSGGLVLAAALEQPVDAPVPVVIDATVKLPLPVAVERPVDAPVPMVAFEPVEAPVPVSAARSRPAEIVFMFASRIRADYRMSCWSWRQYCSRASRRMAAVCRQTRRSLAEFGQVLSQNVRRIDWKARLSSGRNDNAGQRN